MIKRKKWLLMAIALLLTFPAFSFNMPSIPKTIDPVVSTDWLEANLENEELVILDVRTIEDYGTGHIPGSVNVPFTSWWIVTEEGIIMEFPETAIIFDLISSAGITAESPVVLIQKTDTDFSRAEAARVALTLFAAGIKDFSILNGGFNKWAAEEKNITTDVFTPPYSGYYGEMNPRVIVTKDYVKRRLWSATIIDARIPEDFFGVSPLQFSVRPGHISGARCLTTPWIYTPEGSFIDEEKLAAMASGVVGRNKHREIIVYCGVGGYAASWWYFLSQVLGYRNVKVYDGAIQEWSADPEAPMRSYTWR